MEALSLLEKLDIDPAIKAALAAGFQTDIERAQSQHKARALVSSTITSSSKSSSLNWRTYAESSSAGRVNR